MFSLYSLRPFDIKNTCLLDIAYTTLLIKRRNSIPRNDNTFFYLLLSCVSQSTMVVPQLFNIFINDIYFWISKIDLLGITDDNTISASRITIAKPFSTLLQESQAAIKEFKINGTMVNAHKFKPLLIKKLQN